MSLLVNINILLSFWKYLHAISVIQRVHWDRQKATTNIHTIMTKIIGKFGEKDKKNHPILSK